MSYRIHSGLLEKIAKQVAIDRINKKTKTLVSVFASKQLRLSYKINQASLDDKIAKQSKRDTNAQASATRQRLEQLQHKERQKQEQKDNLYSAIKAAQDTVIKITKDRKTSKVNKLKALLRLLKLDEVISDE